MNITMSREEVRSLLNVSECALKSIIKERRLEKRLDNKGLKLLGTYKIGRNVFYKMSPIAKSAIKELQVKYCIKKPQEYEKYIQARLNDNGIGLPRKHIIENNNLSITGKTAKKYDDSLVSEGIIKIKTENKFKQINSCATNTVYRMLDKDNNVIYIGKTNNLKIRIRSHSTEKKIDDWYNNEVAKIEFHSFEEYGDCSIAEMYLITKLKPKYNREFMGWNTNTVIQEFENLEWEADDIINIEEYEYEKGENYDKFMGMLRGER